jgi:catechol 2,3-dioxygenase-like lactoylglutathione lyase family enzyme
VTTTDQAIPVLPARDLRRTLAFYAALGFEGELLAADTYAIVTLGPVELHFFPHPELVPGENYAGCYLRVADVDGAHRLMGAAGLPKRGIPRLEPVGDKPWGMREFALLDEDGNLIKVGRPI